MAEDKKNSLPSSGHEAHKGQASKERGKTGNLQHAGGVLLSTGGGVPIDPGKKWTDERRVLQPRNAANGKFTYNSEAHWGLKYKQRNKANTVPPSAMELVLAAGIDKAGGLKAGSVIVWQGKTQIILKDMSVQELYDYFKKYDEETGDYYKGRSLLEKGDKKDNHRLTANMVAKQGRHSKAENEAIEATKGTWNKGDFGVVGHYDMSRMSNKTAEAMRAKFAEEAAGFDPQGWSVPKSTWKSRAAGSHQENAVDVAGKHPSDPKPLGGRNPDVPNPTGPGKGPDNPPKGGGEGADSSPKGSKSGGIVKDGKVDKSKIDYSNPTQKKYFDDLVSDMKKNPAKYHMTPEQAGKATGEKVARFAKKGGLDAMKWEE